MLGFNLAQSGNEKAYLQMLAQLRKTQARDEMETKLIRSLEKLCPERAMDEIEVITLSFSKWYS